MMRLVDECTEKTNLSRFQRDLIYENSKLQLLLCRWFQNDEIRMFPDISCGRNEMKFRFSFKMSCFVITKSELNSKVHFHDYFDH